jgi:stearoyl-CoA desaturase (delta-9 desaturase)
MPYGKPDVIAPEERLQIFGSLPFIGFHFAALAAAILVPPSAADIALCVGMYYLRMFGIGAGFHRYFAHRTYSTSRAFQFFMAFLGGTAMQKGGLWWAANHRHHHRYSDQPEDVHSPVQRGFWWSHVGWILAGKWEDTDYEAIPDMAKYPELRFLNRWHMLPPVVFAATLVGVGWLIGGPHGALHGFVWGFMVSTVVLWHGTFTINSLSHVFGRRRFKTTDDSRNSLALALITNGEGWHNNHHYYPGAMSNGFYWWQVDLNAYVIRTLQAVGLVWDVRSPPEKVLKLGRQGMQAESEALTPALDPAA